MDRDCPRLNQRGMREGYSIRQMVAQSRRYRNVFCERAHASKRSGRDTDHFSLIAKVDLATATEEALSTEYG